jgi:hypothetical protein
MPPPKCLTATCAAARVNVADRPASGAVGT